MKARTLPLTPKSDQHQISPYNITPESNIKNKGNDHQPKIFKRNSPCQHLKKSTKNSMENIHTDDRAQRVEAHLINLFLCHHR